MERDHTNQVIFRLCRRKTCDNWFMVSDPLFQQQFCSKECKKAEGNSRHRGNRNRKEYNDMLLARHETYSSRRQL